MRAQLNLFGSSEIFRVKISLTRSKVCPKGRAGVYILIDGAKFAGVRTLRLGFDCFFVVHGWKILIERTFEQLTYVFEQTCGGRAVDDAVVVVESERGKRGELRFSRRGLPLAARLRLCRRSKC